MAIQKKAIPLKTILVQHPVTRLPMYRCPYCGNEWLPRTNAPKVCPNPDCHRKLWIVKKGGRK
jgi:rubrerythrin